MHDNTNGILVAMLPVTDLAASAAWYRDLLGLEYLREFERGGVVTGCALYDPQGRYGISLRLRSTTPGRPDLRGEHPVIIGVPDGAALERVRDHAARLGYQPTSGEHGDGSFVEVIDPDGIGLRFVFPNSERDRSFTGLHVCDDGPIRQYDEPLLQLPPPRNPVPSSTAGSTQV